MEVVEKKCSGCLESGPSSLFCKECYRKTYRKTYAKRTKKNKHLLSLIATRLLSDCKKRTKERNSKKENHGKVTLTHEWVRGQLKFGYCQGSFPPIPLVFDHAGSPFSPSLDRIDSSNYDYTPSNVRVVCRAINQARNDMGDKDILTVTESLSGFIKKRRNSI